MLTIRDLSKEVDMTAVRGGNGRGGPSCGGEDSRERFGSDDRHHGDRHGRCERNDDASTPSFASVGINLSSYGLYDATK